MSQEYNIHYHEHVFQINEQEEILLKQKNLPENLDLKQQHRKI